MKSLIPFKSRNVLTRPDDNSQDAFFSLHRQMNRLFENAFRDFNLPTAFFGSAEKPLAWPNVEITETDADIKITAEIPGLTEKDIEVSLDDGLLTLRGEKRSETKKEDKDRHFTERFYGHFERSIQVGPDINADKIAATFENGILTIDLPKTEKSRSKVKQIAIKKKG